MDCTTVYTKCISQEKISRLQKAKSFRINTLVPGRIVAPLLRDAANCSKEIP